MAIDRINNYVILNDQGKPFVFHNEDTEIFGVTPEGHMYQKRFDDIRFPATLARQGVTFKPDFDFTNMGLLFPQNDATEIAYFIGQFPHGRLNGSNIYPHVHFVQDSALQPIFKMDYRWYNNNEDPTGTFTTLAVDSYAFTYTSGSLAQIAVFPEIDGSSRDKVSSIIEIRLYRDDNIVIGDVLVKEFDIHYEIDDFGSRQEFVK